MASTRNNNTRSDYKLQQHQFERMRNYSITPENDTIIGVMYPKFGINIQQAPAQQLSKNSIDLESQLFGIGSSNLVEEKHNVNIHANKIKDVNFIDRMELFVPKFEDITDQRPLFK